MIAALTAAMLWATVAADTPSVRTERIALHLDAVRGTLRLEVLDSVGATELTVEPIALHVNGRAAPERVDIVLEPLSEHAIAVTWTIRGRTTHDLELRIPTDDETAFYGGGERFHALDQRGYVLPMISDDRYGNKGVGSYKPVPFVLSTRGWGIWLDQYTPSTFDLNATERFVARVSLRAEYMRVVFIGGPSPGDVLAGYTALAGRPPLPPPWAFTLWKSRDVHHNQDSVMADVRRMRELGIPGSVLVLDSPWETGYNDFVVNRRQFANPDEMFARVRAAGFEPCLWITPFINRRNVIDMVGIDTMTSIYEEAANGRLVRDSTGEVALMDWWKGRGGLVDFTDPAATQWWLDRLARTYEWGVRCFKADDGEGNFVPHARFADGTPAPDMRNRYAVLYDSAVAAYIDEHFDGRGTLIARSGYAGAQRYGFLWGGDNRGDFSFRDGLPSVIIAAQNAALSGMPLWGADIAGYAGVATPEVFVRWTQFATFTPFMQVHMTSNRGPWDYGERALAIFRTFARLRMRLLPYILETAHEASRGGLPPVRPMVLAFPENPDAHDHIFQFLFGSDLLVAPVYQEAATMRTVYLPPGEWIDYWRGEALTGGGVVQVAAPLEHVPLFVRAGAILPLLPDDVVTAVEPHEALAPAVVAMDDRRVLEVWPGERGTLVTMDGLVAQLQMDGAGRSTLRVESRTPRPVDVRLRDRAVDEVHAPGGEIVQSADGTVVRYDRLAGSVVIAWSAR